MKVTASLLATAERMLSCEPYCVVTAEGDGELWRGTRENCEWWLSVTKAEDYEYFMNIGLDVDSFQIVENNLHKIFMRLGYAYDPVTGEVIG